MAYSNRLLIFVLAMSLLSVNSAFGKIYKWVDEHGRVQMSDRPPPAKDSDEPHSLSQSPAKQARHAGQANMQIGSYPESSIVKLRQQLKQRQYSALSQSLKQLHSKAAADIHYEEVLMTGFQAFKINDKNHEGYFDDWIKAEPGSYVAYLARAKYFYELGWYARGNNWKSETKPEQFEQMQQYFKKSQSDVARALKINDRSPVAYVILLGIAKAAGSAKETSLIAHKALKLNPLSFAVRSLYLSSLTPRWGGSMEKMMAFVEESLGLAAQNPRLNVLAGLVYADAANMESITRRYSVAKELYDKALEFGEYHKLYRDRGTTSYQMKDYRAAVADLSRAIELQSQKPDYYYWRSKAYAHLQQFEQAANDIQYAYRLDPYDPRIQRYKETLAAKLESQGYQLSRNQQSTAAIDRFNSAISLNSDDASLYYRRARAYIDDSRFNLALADVKTALRLDPHDINHYLLVDYILAKRKDFDQIIRYWDQFIALHPQNGRAYFERGGAYFHKGDMKSAVANAKKSAALGNPEGKEAYEKFKSHLN